jgi:hypothetical protein
MTAIDWYDKRDDRTMRYAGRRLDQQRRVCLRLSPADADSYAGQVCLFTAANLLGRMTPSITIDLPSQTGLDVVPPLPGAGRALGEVMLERMQPLDPYNQFHLGCARPDDVLVQIGREGTGPVIHGSGWGAYVGPSPSPLPRSAEPNPFGPGFAAIIAMAHLFIHDFTLPTVPMLFDTLHWQSTQTRPSGSTPEVNLDLGDLWVIGTGSVGTSLLYFLTLFTRNFDTVLIDMDEVKVENLNRAAIFGVPDVGQKKVVATAKFLNSLGVRSVRTEVAALHESAIWTNRQEGTPDIVVSAANEMNVRYNIEQACPPIQIYGTTGKQWQAALVRHIPFVDPCSCCLFEPEHSTATACASAPIKSKNGEDQIDAALPFLSFAAGLMAAAEIVKLGLPGFPFSRNRVFLYTNPAIRLTSAETRRRDRCLCHTRSDSVHRQMLRGSKYYKLSPESGLD